MIVGHWGMLINNILLLGEYGRLLPCALRQTRTLNNKTIYWTQLSVFLNNVGDFWCLDCIKCESCILHTVSHLQEPSINIKKGKVYMYFLTNYKRTCNLWTLFFKLRKVLYLKQKLCNDPNNSTWTWQQHDNKLCNHIQIYCVPFSSVLLIISTDDTVPKVLKRSL